MEKTPPLGGKTQKFATLIIKLGGAGENRGGKAQI